MDTVHWALVLKHLGSPTDYLGSFVFQTVCKLLYVYLLYSSSFEHELLHKLSNIDKLKLKNVKFS